MSSGRMSVLAGAPGSGKTAVAPYLRRLLPGLVVLDMDEFLPAGGRLAGVDLRHASDRWPAYNDVCLTLVASVLVAGHDVLLLSPLTPDELDRSVAAPLLGKVRWAVLDCSEPSRRARLEARSATEDDVQEALVDAAALRALDVPIFMSEIAGVEVTARSIATWARSDHV
jgi:predicted kinase